MIRYEWLVELVTADEYEDIEDVAHYTNYADCLRMLERGPGVGYFQRVGVVRDVIDDTGDLTDRSWAYIDEGKLPEFFQDASGNDASRVPKRFHAEIKRL